MTTRSIVKGTTRELTATDPRTARSDLVLLQRYRRRREQAVRDQIVERFRPEIERLVRHMLQRLPASIDPRDLVHAGISGLIQAIERFDASRGAAFQAFMFRRVRGSIVDELRTADWLPRLMRIRLAKRDVQVQRLRQELGREPTDAEIADALRLTLPRYRSLFGSVPACAPARPLAGAVSFDDGEAGGIEFLTDPAIAHPLDNLYREEVLARVDAMLTPAERRMVHLHYFEGLKLCEVARQLQLSPARVCQIHGHILDKLKRRLIAGSVAV